MSWAPGAAWGILICAVLVISGCRFTAGTPLPAALPSETSIPRPATTRAPTATLAPTSTSTPTLLPTSTPTLEPTPTPWLLVEDGVTVQAADGVNLVGTFYAPQVAAPPWPGVILLHMVYGSRQDWQAFAERLTDAGYAVLALDMRAHGDSGGSLEWDKFEADLLRVWDYFTGRGDVLADHSGVVGASIGANMALVLGASQPAISAVGLLSPGLDYYGVTTADAVQAYGQRPLLIVASEEDSYSAESSRQLQELAGGEVHLEMYSGAGHGTVMLGREPGLADLILDWLDRDLKP